MADEQSKSARRRFNEGVFHARYFVGKGIDIGAGSDSLAKYFNEFPRITSLCSWDLINGDAQKLKGLANNDFDFVHSSHCLEHMVDPYEALSNWLRVVKSGGYLVITIPDEDMYERGKWPSGYNPDHKHSFTISKEKSWSPVSINVFDMLTAFNASALPERVIRLGDFYNSALIGDQTKLANPECAIEFVVRKI